MTIKGQLSAVDFDGKHSEINNYLLNKTLALEYDDTRIPLNQEVSHLKSIDVITQKIDSIRDSEVDFFNNYIKRNKLPSWFIDYEISDIVYICELFKLYMFKKLLPHSSFGDIQKYFSDIKINNSQAILSGSYYRFLNEYFLFDTTINAQNGLDWRRATYGHYVKKSRVELAEEIHDVYRRGLFADLIRSSKEKCEADSIAEVFGISKYQNLLVNLGSALKVESDAGPQSNDLDIASSEFFVSDVNDNLYSSSQFLGKIQYINFWATWCGPCIKNIPNLNSLIAGYSSDKRIEFVNICLDSDRDDWLKVIEQRHLKGRNLFAGANVEKTVSDFFSIKAFPHYVLIDEKNNIIENNTLKAPLVKTKIDSLLEIRMKYPE